MQMRDGKVYKVFDCSRMVEKLEEQKIIIISSDNVLPPKAILTYEVFFDTKKVYLTLGMN